MACERMIKYPRNKLRKFFNRHKKYPVYSLAHPAGRGVECAHCQIQGYHVMNIPDPEKGSGKFIDNIPVFRKMPEVGTTEFPGISLFCTF